jgi:hypothetical protein
VSHAGTVGVERCPACARSLAWIQGVTLLLLAARCTPIPLPPGEEEAWRRNSDRRESWAPCEKRFNVPWRQGDGFTHDAEVRCDSGQGKACEQRAFVEVNCQMFSDRIQANKFAGRACALGEVAGCLLQIQLCDTRKARCSPETRKSLEEQACRLGDGRACESQAGAGG